MTSKKIIIQKYIKNKYVFKFSRYSLSFFFFFLQLLCLNQDPNKAYSSHVVHLQLALVLHLPPTPRFKLFNMENSNPRYFELIPKQHIISSVQIATSL